MLIHEAFYSILSANAEIKNIVNASIFPVDIPNRKKGEIVYPALLFSRTGCDREQTHDGPSRIVKSYFGVVCLGQEYFPVITLAEKVRLAILGKSAELAQLYTSHVKGVFLDSQGPEEYVWETVEELSLYRVAMEFRIHHWEELPN